MNRVAFIFLMCIGQSCFAQLKHINGSMTINEFALQCQHPAHKTEPQARGEACIDYAKIVSDSIGKVNRTPECWADLEAQAFPGALLESIFYLAAISSEKKKPLATVSRQVVLTVAKNCK